jgi:hypothetical protein
MGSILFPNLKIFLTCLFLNFIKKGGVLGVLLYVVLTLIQLWIFVQAATNLLFFTFLSVPQLCHLQVVLKEIR